MSDSQGPWGAPEQPSGAPKRPPSASPRRRGLGLVLAIVALVGLGVWGLSALFPGQLSTNGDWNVLIQCMGVLLLVTAGLVSARRVKLTEVARAIVGWIAIASVLVLGFVYRGALTDVVLRVRAALIPGYATNTGAHELTLSADDSGGYRVTGQVNGQRVIFMVDTGASDIVLSPADAARVGIDPATLHYTRGYETANGYGGGAPFTARSLDVGPIHLTNVAMSVNQAPMRSSLLGMPFLKRLRSFEIRDNQLILKW